MILTCPACATRYFVDADRLGPEGRQVRCSSCANLWKAEASVEPLELTPEPATTPAPASPVKNPLHKSFRAEVQARRRTRKAVAAGVVWAGMAATIALFVLGLVVFRTSVVGAWPATAGAYAWLKMPVNPTGFAIEEVQGGPSLNEGRIAIVASGALRNVRDDARPTPPVRVSLYDAAGKRVASQVVLPSSARVAPGDARLFKANFVDPPGASHVQVEFAFDVKLPRPPAQKVARPSAPASSPTAAQPAAVSAKSLPANSPYALRPTPRG